MMAGCSEKKVTPLPPPPGPPQYDSELPAGQMGLVKIPPHMYPDFSQGFEHKTNLIQSALYSRQYLEKPSSRQFFPYLDITHERAIASIDAFIDVIQTARSGQELDQMIKQRFDVYQSRGYQDMNRPDTQPPWTPPDTGIVLFTGYYRPIFEARLRPDAEFKWPLYRKPAELVLDPNTMHYRSTTGGPYLTRAQIENGALRGRGLELCYLRDWFETYIVTIQGSAKLRLEDGSFLEIGYAADNGYEYHSIGRELVSRGEIPANKLSLQTLIDYFRQHPEKREEAIAINPRYIFFQHYSGGPFGSLGVPVTAFRSIATDKGIFPRAGVCYIDTMLPARVGAGQIENRHYGGFAMDQDTGGAIRAAGRCDVFMGTGDEWGELAGRTFSEGNLYYIYVKEGATAPATEMTASPSPYPTPAPYPTAQPQPATPNESIDPYAPPASYGRQDVYQGQPDVYRPPAPQSRQPLTSQLPPS